MGLFERFLSFWVAAAMLIGVGFGIAAPGAAQALASLEVAHVNLVVAVLIWLMVYPMMLRVRPSALRDARQAPAGLALTVVVNWLIKPFTMAGLGILFFRYVFANWVPAEEAAQYIAGMILLGAAPCTAMVFVWSNLTDGDAGYTLVQVTVNDLILVFAYAPIVAWLLGVTDLTVPWETLVLSVLIYIVIPLVAGILTQRGRTPDEVEALAQRLKPASVIGLILTVVLLFAFQADTLTSQPGRVLMIAIPLLFQSYGIFILAYLAAWLLRLPHTIAAPAALIGTSNFFELAVAVAISLFGLESGAALATVVGVLIEVPVMLSLVRIANRTRDTFPDATPQGTPA
ncbi:MAG: arsenical-resistance protein [Candidatus Dadabacteria bacterium]|nr:MAG: arsenical-resistance protein [Candidatus Dadabacteria bacterium]